MPRGLFTLKQQLQGVIQKAWNTTINPLKTPAVDYLVVAGGGGASGGGGGAGGLLQGTVPVPAGSALTVTVGGGGPSYTQGTSSVFSTISALGGGQANNNPVCGSGGGQDTINVYAYGLGTVGQGNNGGIGGASGSNAGGGGGGAGTVGLTVTGTVGGAGGAGIASAISGTVTAYAGGGGGGGPSGGAGGAGGGGAGSITGVTAYDGTANTGGGGGGGYTSGPKSGGSGIVIVSYPDIYAGAASTTGSPTVSTSGAGSFFGNGGSNYLRYAGQTPFVFGTGDFTLECWYYPTSFSTYPTLYDFRASDASGNGPTVYCYTNGTLAYGSSGTDRITGAILSLNQWYHIAVCRISGSTKMYLNGVQTGSTYTDSTNYTCGATSPTININCVTNSGSLLGYTTNFRFVKGVGVYTGTFTPPTTPLTSVQSAGVNISAITGTSTSLLLNATSGSYLADGSTNSYVSTASASNSSTWNQASPFATGLGYKNRVYTYTGSGTITF